MPDAVANDPISYLGEFRHGVDPKHRMAVPSQFRSKDPTVQYTLMLWSDGAPNDTRLMVLPPEKLKSLREFISQKPLSDRAATNLRRLLGVGSAIVTLDSAGRILIPESLMKQAGISNEAVIVGLMNVFEIWSPERFAAVMGTMTEEDKAEARKLI
jgi:MraZ protein